MKPILLSIIILCALGCKQHPVSLVTFGAKGDTPFIVAANCSVNLEGLKYVNRSHVSVYGHGDTIFLIQYPIEIGDDLDNLYSHGEWNYEIGKPKK